MPLEAKLERRYHPAPMHSTEVFKPAKSVPWVAALSLILTASAVVYSFYDPLVLLLAALFGSSGIPLAFYTRARYILDDEKIVYKNPLGRRTQIYWRDVTSVYYVPVTGKMFVYGSDNSIPIHIEFKDVDRLWEIIKDRCEHVMNTGSVINTPAGLPKDFKNTNGTIVFRQQTIVLVFSVIFELIIVGAIVLLFILPPPEHINIAHILTPALMFITTTLFFLGSLVSRVYIDSEKIVLRNLFGIKKQIMWSEVKSATASSDNIKLSGGGKRLKITRNFSGFEIITDLTEKYLR